MNSIAGPLPLRFLDRRAQQRRSKGTAVDRDDLHPRSKARFVAHATDDDIANMPIAGDLQAKRETRIDAAALRLAQLRPVVRMVDIHQLVAAERIDAAHLRRMKLVRVETLAQESRPVVRHNRVEPGNDILKRVRHNLGRRVAAETFERPGKIVEALLAIRLVADDQIGFQPQQLALVVVVRIAAEVVVRSAGRVEHLRHRRGVLQVAPGTPRTHVVQIPCDRRQPVAINLR